MQTGATSPNNVAPTMLRVVSCVLAVVCKRMQQVWDLQCTVGRIQPISLCNPCGMSVRGPNDVGRTVQTDPTSLRDASAITEKKKCWELLAEKFNRFQTLRNNAQQHPTTCNRVCKRTQHVTFNNVGTWWPTMLRPFARGLRLRANGRNNSQHCCANDFESYCVRVGSGVQTDATTPNKFGTCSASWEEYNPLVFVIHA